MHTFGHGWTRPREVFLNVFCLKNAWTQPEAVDVQFGFTKTKSEKFPQFPLIRIRCQVGRKPKLPDGTAVGCFLLDCLLLSDGYCVWKED
jgi:hypothetical protein